MFGLFVSMAILGLSAFDPVGIAAMPVLLLQKNPYRRCLTFLSGSFFSLLLMGILFSRGFGAIVLRFENTHTWLVPIVELIAGLMLLSIAGIMLWRVKVGKLSIEPNNKMIKRLQLRNWQLFIFGALLVAIQSIIDVVFSIAMIHIGQLHLRFPTLLAAITTYACFALALQIAVVGAYSLTPLKQRVNTLDKVDRLLQRYAKQTMIGISFLLGCVLLFLSVQRL